LLPERYQLIYAMNPMAGVIEGFRWSSLNTLSSFSGQYFCGYRPGNIIAGFSVLAQLEELPRLS
jgi:ABC-type polysaccharide/polyol phosphate export permease